MTFNPPNATDAPDFTHGPGLGNGTLVFDNAFPVPAGGTVAGPFYCGIGSGLFMNVEQNYNSSVQLIWSTDSAGANQIQNAIYSTFTNVQIFDAMVNPAPWVQIRLNNGTGLPQTNFVQLQVVQQPIGLGQMAAFASVAGNRILKAVSNQAVAANNFVQLDMGVCVPGPALLYLESDHLPAEALISPKVGAQNGFHLQGFQLATGGPISDTRRVIIPNDACNLVLVNGNAAAANFNVAVLTER